MTENKNLRRQYGEAGYIISQDYLPNTIMEELIQLYKEMLESDLNKG